MSGASGEGEPDVFRGRMTFRNRPETILRFPFPFAEGHYTTTVNLEPHDRTGPSAAYHALFDIDEHYEAEVAERALVLAQDPSRCQMLPHMMPAQWDGLALIMQALARDFPGSFSCQSALNSIQVGMRTKTWTSFMSLNRGSFGIRLG